LGALNRHFSAKRKSFTHHEEELLVHFSYFLDPLFKLIIIYFIHCMLQVSLDNYKQTFKIPSSLSSSSKARWRKQDPGRSRPCSAKQKRLLLRVIHEWLS
jgi:hypothetical protein